MKLKLIQIDDDLINNMVNERLLKKMGIDLSIISFLNPVEAISYLTHNNDDFDLMFLDINMPMLTGWEFLEKYKQLDKNIPIVMLTTSLDAKDEQKANENSLLSGFYIKPLTQEMINDIFIKCKLVGIN